VFPLPDQSAHVVHAFPDPNVGMVVVAGPPLGHATRPDEASVHRHGPALKGALQGGS